MANYVREDLNKTGNPDREILLTWLDLAKEDDRIVFVEADSLLYLFAEEIDALPESYRDWFWSTPDRKRRLVTCGIQEANAALVSAGLAAQGFKVFYPEGGGWGGWLYERAYQMIAYSICIERYDVTMVGGAGGIGGRGGTTHHILRDIATMSAIPNMIVTAAADPVEAKKIALFAYKYIGPKYIRAAGFANIIFTDEYEFKLGEAPVVREGDDATIIGMQEWVYKGLLAAEKLAKEGIETRVINMSSIKPIGKKAIIKAAKETGAIVTAESTNIHGGMGSAVAGVLGESYPVPIKRLALHDLFTHSSSGDLPDAYYHQTVDDLVAAVKETVKRK